VRRDPSRHDVVVVGARAAGAATVMPLVRGLSAAMAVEVEALAALGAGDAIAVP
jgi:hypothetical protein